MSNFSYLGVLPGIDNLTPLAKKKKKFFSLISLKPIKFSNFCKKPQVKRKFSSKVIADSIYRVPTEFSSLFSRFSRSILLKFKAFSRFQRLIFGHFQGHQIRNQCKNFQLLKHLHHYKQVKYQRSVICQNKNLKVMKVLHAKSF